MNQQLTILNILCDIHGLLEINGSPAGETAGGSLQLFVPEGRFFLSFTPLHSAPDRIYLPFSRILSLDEDPPSITGNDGAVILQLLPENVIQARLFPPYVPLDPPIVPHIVRSHAFNTGGRGYRAAVYFDRIFNFSLEDSSGRALFAYGFPEKISSPQIAARRIGEDAYVLVQVQGKEKRLLCVRVDPPGFVFDIACTSYIISDGVLHVYADVGEPYGHMLDQQYSQKPEGLTKTAESLVAQGDPQAESHENTLLSFALAIEYGAGELALSHLAPSFRGEVAFSDLQEFFGEFSGIDRENCTADTVAFHYAVAENVFVTRIFHIEWSGGKISNIS